MIINQILKIKSFKIILRTLLIYTSINTCTYFYAYIYNEISKLK